ncbi:MAG: class I SAM-dependent methyltransferase [Bradyrhizobium sp.]
MSGFSVEWLTLREGYDIRARNPAVLGAAISLLKSKSAVRLVDLACGTGSTLRSLSPQLPARQHWDLVDNDSRLLNAARAGHLPDNVGLNAVQLDLNSDLEIVLNRPSDLIATSALLDLVSEAWLERFANQASARGLPVYAALTYNGRIDLFPVDRTDAAITAAVNAHQHTDKGFGPALGPSAAAAAISRFEMLGYSTVQGMSDWILGTTDRDIQIELLNGWATAASEMQCLPGREIDHWLTRRREAVEQQTSTMRVGHVDFLAAPSTTR